MCNVFDLDKVSFPICSDSVYKVARCIVHCWASSTSHMVHIQEILFNLTKKWNNILDQSKRCGRHSFYSEVMSFSSLASSTHFYCTKPEVYQGSGITLMLDNNYYNNLPILLLKSIIDSSFNAVVLFIR